VGPAASPATIASARELLERAAAWRARLGIAG
jgi:hypothetical protein